VSERKAGPLSNCCRHVYDNVASARYLEIFLARYLFRFLCLDRDWNRSVFPKENVTAKIGEIKSEPEISPGTILGTLHRPTKLV
jgi:hypothetical protein